MGRSISNILQMLQRIGEREPKYFGGLMQGIINPQLMRYREILQLFEHPEAHISRNAIIALNHGL